MKRILTFVMALGALLMSACGEPEAEKSVLTITSATAIFEAEGGEGIISYTIQNPVAGMQVIAKCDAEWVDGLTSGDAVTFTVLPNTTGELRSTKITVSYGSDCLSEVGISQKSTGSTGGGNDNDNNNDNVIRMEVCESGYYGNYYSILSYNYYIVLSESGLDEDGNLPEGEDAYTFDIFSNTSLAACGYGLPTGTYTFDEDGTTASNTMGYYSVYYASDGNVYEYLEGSSITISKNRIEANLKLSNGLVHKVVYEGEFYTYDLSEGYDDGGYDDGGDDDWGDYYGYSNLGGDYTVKMSGNDIYMSITNYGDYYEVGCNNYWIDIYEDGNTGVGLYLSLDLLTNASADALAGTYTPSYDATSYEKVYVEGGIDEEGYLFGCWLLTLDGDSVDESGPLAPMYDGTITLAKSGSKYTVTYNCYDDAGNKITGSVSAEYEYYDYSDEYSAPRKSAKKTAPHKWAKAQRSASFKKVIRR